MATLKAIRKRIAAVGSTKKLTRAMKMISAARLRKAQVAALEARAFNRELMRFLLEIVKNGTEIKHPLLSANERKTKSIDLIVFTSDRGLCGTFNENLLKRVDKFIALKAEEGTKVLCTVFGKKGRDYLKRAKADISKEFVQLSSAEIEKIVDEEITFFIDRFVRGDTEEVIIAYNQFKHAGSQTVDFLRLLPAQPPQAEQEYGVDYIYEPSRDGLIDWILNSAVKSNLRQAYMETVASELASRMVAMDIATKNAEDLINSLTIKYNRARQATITKELIDIVGAAEAMK